MGYLVCFFQVISSAVGTSTVKILLSTSASKNEADLIDELSSSIQLIFIVEVLRETQRAL